MTVAVNDKPTKVELPSDNAALRERLRVAEDTLQAILRGEVDSLVARTPQGPRVFTLVDASRPYRTLVEEMQHGAAMLSIGIDGVILFCNHSFADLLGVPVERVVGALWHNFVAEGSAAALAALLDKAADKKAHAELNLTRADGKPVPVLLSATPLLTEEVRVTSLVVTDLSERKRAEQAQQESAAAFRLLADLVPQMVWMCQADGLNIYFNQRWVDYTGLTLEESYGHGWSTPFHPDDKQPASNAWNQAVATGCEYRIESRLRAVDGSFHWFLIKGMPQRDAKGTVVKWFGTCTDIESLKQLETALTKRAEELERSNQDLQQFAYVASHDLQEPLRMIASYVELLARRYQGQIDEKADKFIHYIVDGAVRMQTLIDDLLTFSRVTTKAKAFTLTSAETLLAEALSNLQKSITDKEAFVTHAPLPDVWVDAMQFEQVLLNLIGNALKFCTDKPKVHVQAEQRGRDWVFSVRDNGIGIAPEHRERLFVLFQRLHTREHYPGTGIGLAVSKKVIERHGGRIWVESEPGKGSTFYFTIPVNREQKR